MADIDARELASLIASRFSVAFEGSIEEVDGGRFTVIRPSDLERGTGFCVVVGRTPRRIEASFKADRFAAALLRQMAEADSEARALFVSLLNEAEKTGTSVSATLNDAPIKKDGDLIARDWLSFEIDCDKKVPLRAPTQDFIAKTIFEVTSTCISLALSLLPLEDSRDFPPLFEDGLPEGASMKMVVNRYERNRNNRAACIAHYGDSCIVCNFNFGEIYGKLGQGVIEVHHLIMVSAMGGDYRVNPRTDLVPVCSNCHTMMHRRNPPLDVTELKKLLL